MTLCGEMAGKPISARLIGLGFRSVSMSPAAIGLWYVLLGLDAGALAHAMNEALDDKDVKHPVRDILNRFAETRNIPL